MQTSDGSVGVDARRRAMLPDDLLKTVDIVPKFLRSDGRVLDKRDGLGVTLHCGRQAERRFAQTPHLRLAGEFRFRSVGVTKIACPKILLERRELRRQFLLFRSA